MSSTAVILCVGPYREDLLESLDYPKDRYDPEGEHCLIVTDVCQCETASKSHLLAEALGVPPGNICRHEVNPDRIDWKTLNAEFGGEAFALGKLLHAGFLAFFRPEC